MNERNSVTPASLVNLAKRAEILAYLRELAADNPEEIWRKERERGFASDIDQVFHFFFDDNDFDDAAVGVSLVDTEEVRNLAEVKSLLNAMLSDLPDGDDEAFVRHNLWPRLRATAHQALGVFEMQS